MKTARFSKAVSSANFGRQVAIRRLFRLPIFFALERISQTFADDSFNAPTRFAQLTHDHISNHLSIFGHYDRYRLQALFGWFKQQNLNLKDWRVLDIGANIGIHTHFFAHECNSVVAYEPNPDLVPLLSYNLRFKPNVAIRPIGLSDATGSLFLNRSYTNTGSSYVSHESTDCTRTIKIPVSTLDTHFLEYGRVDLIKMDVEGHELNVIRGGETLITTHRPFIVFEQNMTAFSDNLSETIEQLKCYGYKQFMSISEFPGGWDSSSTIKQLLKRLLILPLIGERIELRAYSNPPPGNYSMLLAIP